MCRFSTLQSLDVFLGNLWVHADVIDMIADAAVPSRLGKEDQILDVFGDSAEVAFE
jgi:hypothetical protein